MITFYTTPQCPVCSSEIPADLILCEGCREILNQFELNSPGRCGKCYNILTGGECLYCSGRNIFFDRHISFYTLNELWKKYLLRWKFENDRRLGMIFLEKLCLIPENFIRKESLICYLNSGKYGYDVRSYQPCRDPAEKWGEFLSLPVYSGLKKNKKFHQSGKNRKERFLDLRNAYSLSMQCSEKNVILIEDVFTTGATANECARILKNSGALSVNLICFLMREQLMDVTNE